MRTLILMMICLVASVAQAQDFNLELLSNVQYSSAQEYGNDIWGFVDKNGLEYAVVGSRESTLLYELSDPANPQLVYEVEGAVGIWRDMKSIGDYIYVTADQGMDGLLVIDMSAVGDSITHNFWRPMYDKGDGMEQLRIVHNLYADDRYVYLAGLDNDSQTGGVLILDTEADPLRPPVVGIAREHYSHDVYVQDSLMYSSEIFIGEIGIYDISDPSNPVRIAGQQTTTNFAHNAWLSDDGNYMFTTDEVQDAFVDAYDISDLDNIQLLDTYQPYRPDQAAPTIPHNTHYYNGYLVTSWYEDGVVVVDAHKPDNLVEVASYDTYPGPSGTGSGFNGCWGVTPFLPSGLMLVNDINSGLYVFRPNYVRASYLEGMVVDSLTREPLPGATIEIMGSRPHLDIANDGSFKTGIGESGTFDVRVRALGYDSRIVSVNLEAGVVNNQIFALLERAQLTTILEDAATESMLSSGQVLLVNEEFGETIESEVNLLGAAVAGIDRGVPYDLYATSWGYVPAVVEDVVIQSSEMLTVGLEAGYEDDFYTDQGWEVFSTSSSGQWERGVPQGTENPFEFEISNPDTDVDFDRLNFAYVTGNSGIGLGDDDIDDGTTTLVSPPIDASGMTAGDTLTISASYWFYNCCGNGGPEDDTLQMHISNGMDTLLLFATGDNSGGWQPVSFTITSDMITFTSDMRFSVTAGDTGEGHIAEAGLDAFRARLGTTTPVSVEEVELVDLTVSPSPFSDQVTISSEADGLDVIQIFDINGRLVMTAAVEDSQTQIATGTWQPGVYYVRMIGAEAVSQTIPVVKQ